MARKSGPTIEQEELYPPPDESGRGELDDARVLDLEVEQESPFLRGQKRVSVRRGALPKKTATRIAWLAVAAVVLVLGSILTAAVYHYGEHSWRFRVESSDDIEVAGLENVTKTQVMEVMGGDIGRNIFFVPLSDRQTQLEQIPWVESASVMRFVPNRLKVEIHERVPVTFARVGSRILLTDAGGTLMDLPGGAKKKFSFPVILGMNSGEPLSTRAARMKFYNQLVRDLDYGGAHYSQELSEVDLGDPDDVKVLANDPAGAVLVHLGSANYLERYKFYIAHLQEWRQQFTKIESVDLRYDHQVVVNPEQQAAAPKPPHLSVATAKAAVAAGVKPAALIAHDTVVHKSVAGAAPSPKPAIKKAAVKKQRRKAVMKKAKASATSPKAVAKPSPSASTAKPSAAVATTTKPAAAGKKPSAAIAKNKDQDHP